MSDKEKDAPPSQQEDQRSDDQQSEVKAGLKQLADVLLEDSRVKQGVIILIGEEDDYSAMKGHFYDHAALLNSILKEYRKKIYMEVFTDKD